MPRRLYLVRYGETDANFFKIIDGQGIGVHPEYGSPLNHSGSSQACKLGHALSKVKIHHIYMSPARRAIQTANQICLWTHCDNLSLKRSVVKDLLEINFGILEGLNGQKAREKYPDLLKIYHEKPSLAFFPEGESVAGAYRRISFALDEILAAHIANENILIVSHGGVITLIFIHIFKLDLDTMFHAIRHHNCGLSIIEWEKPDSPKIICINDISHLTNEYAERIKNPTTPFLSGQLNLF